MTVKSQVIPPEVLDMEIEGWGLDAKRLGEALGGGRPTLLVFLRHFG